MTASSLPAATPLRRSAAVVTFTLTIFVSASLLFFVQPLFTKLAVPQIGGAAAVWTTAMLFFQTALIGGYLYAHLSTRHLSTGMQVALHLCLLILAMLFLPLAIPQGWAYDPAGSAAGQTLALYAMGVGLPFAVLSANAPLIQSWYSRTGGPSADDPYFLYGASNLGSLIALLAFPLVAEPLFGATAIGRGWAAGFVLLTLLLAACGVLARSGAPKATVLETAAATASPTLRQIATWALLAFIPSSLMLGVTSKISTDLGSIPLVWVVPLSLYLLTFVLTFTPAPRLSDALLARLLPVALIFLAILGTALFNLSLSWPMAALLTLGFFGTALAAHRQLFRVRPAAAHLTVFYVTMSVGGALGGLFNSIVAPLVFNDFHELPLIVALSAIALCALPSRSQRDIAIAAAATAVALLPPILNAADGLAGPSRLAALGLAALVLAGLAFRRARKAPVAAAIVAAIAGTAVWHGRDDVLMRDRSFFGAHKIVERDGQRLYYNGTTIHGAQRLAELSAPRPSPLYYYHKDGSMAQVLGTAKAAAATEIGVVGLGVGALACYSRPGQNWHFYEIDGEVDVIARNADRFTFMQTCAPDAPTYLGDARVVLQRQTDLRYDVLFLDAYSSDAVPVHLATREAVQLYLDRMATDGLLVFHISNRYYDLEVPLARIAGELGLTAMVRRHGQDGAPLAEGDTPSVVAVMARDAAVLAEFASDPRWTPMTGDGGAAWTDDRSNLLGILR